MKLSIPLVGMHFRPPAAQVLAALPLGTTVYLVREPSNERDPNAVKVVADVQNSDVKTHVLEALLAGTQFTVNEVMGQPVWLGYLAMTGGKPAAGGPGNVEALMLMSAAETKMKLEVDVEAHWKRYSGKLSCLPDGRPSVDMEY